LPPPADLVPARKPRRQRRQVEQYRTDDAEHVAKALNWSDDLDSFGLRAALSELQAVLADNRRALGRDRQG
jgi:hypothetical protein